MISLAVWFSEIFTQNFVKTGNIYAVKNSENGRNWRSALRAEASIFSEACSSWLKSQHSQTFGRSAEPATFEIGGSENWVFEDFRRRHYAGEQEPQKRKFTTFSLAPGQPTICWCHERSIHPQFSAISPKAASCAAIREWGRVLIWPTKTEKSCISLIDANSDYSEQTVPLGNQIRSWEDDQNHWRVSEWPLNASAKSHFGPFVRCKMSAKCCERQIHVRDLHRCVT